MKTLLLILVVVSYLATPAIAQDTISLFGDDGSGNSRFMFVGAAPFDIVTVGSGDVQAFEDAGVTWRVKSVLPFTQSLDEMKETIKAGPQQ